MQNDWWEEEWKFMRPLTNISFSDRIRPSAAVCVCQKTVGIPDGGEKKNQHIKKKTLLCFSDSAFYWFAIDNRQEAEKLDYIRKTF